MRRGAFSGRGDDDEHGPTARTDTGAPHRNGRPRGGRSKPTAGTAAWDDGMGIGMTSGGRAGLHRGDAVSVGPTPTVSLKLNAATATRTRHAALLLI